MLPSSSNTYQLLNKTRLIWLDNLKAFLILIVILGHAVQLLNPVAYQQDVLFRYIYSFHMPLFVFISGFACYRLNVEWGLVKRRVVQLIIPFTLWSIVQCLINGHLRIWEMFLFPERSLWFLYVLFFVTVFHVVSIRISKRIKIKEEVFVTIVAVILLASMFVFRLFGWPIIAKYFMFYSMGFYSRKYIKFEQRSIFLTLILLAAFLIAAFYCMQDSAPSFMPDDSNSLYKYPYNFFVAFLGITAFMLLFANFFNRNLSSLIGYIGGGTLGLYAIHRTIGLWLASLIIMHFKGTCDLSQESLYYVYVFFTWLGVSLVSWIIMVLLEKNKYMSMLFLGKKIK